MTLPLVSIIFITHNGLEDTLDLLESLEKINYPKEKLQLIMVDNASEDGSPKIIKQKYSQVKIISLDKNYGYAYAVNRGIEKAQGEYIFVLNNDVILHQEALKELIKRISQDKNIGAIGGKIYLKDKPHILTSAGEGFNPWTTALKKTFNPEPDKEKEVDWIQGCSILFPKKIIDIVGGWDEGYFLYFEDADFCARIKKANFKILYYPKAVIWHKVGQSIDKLSIEKKKIYYYRSKFRYLFKNYNLFYTLSGLLITFFYVLYKRLSKKEKGPVYEWLALKDNIKNWKKLKTKF